MREVKVLVDSCADMTADLLKEYDIDYARMNTVRDGVQTPASLTWEYYTPQELYNTIRSGVRITTTQVPPEEFMRIFTLYLEKGMDILYIGCCSKQSGSVNTGRVVARELLPKYPGARIEIIDPLNSSIGQGYLAMQAVKALRAGKDLDAVCKEVCDLRPYINQFVTVNTLDYLHKAGRVKGSKAFFGNLMGVKPILISDADGEQTPVKKAKGRLGSFTEVINMMADAVEGCDTDTIYIAHADCSKDELGRFTDMVKAKFPGKNLVTVYIGPIIGASIGPDAIGLWAVGKEVTYRVAEQ